jgi:hypothetical protein
MKWISAYYVFFYSVNVLAAIDCQLKKLNSIDDLKVILNNPECKIDSKEALIRAIPDSFKTNPILVYKSESLQGPHEVDYLNPRALLFDNPGTLYPESSELDKNNFMLSFNGNPKDEGFKAIEIFDYKSKKMFELTFDDKKATLNDETDGKCLRCHGNPPRPIFQSYPDWSGVFGSQHLGTIPPEEEKGFQDFIKKSNENPNSIYSLLKLTYKDVQPFMGQVAENNVNFNGKLNSIFFKNNFAKNEELKKSSFSYAIAGALKQCKNFFDFFPKDLKNKFYENISKKYDFNKNWSKKQILDFDKDIDNYPRLFRLAKGYDDYNNYLINNKKFKPFLFDTFKKQGLQSATLSGAFLRFIFEGQNSNFISNLVDLRSNQFKTSALFNEEVIANEFMNQNLSCEELKDLSLKSLSSKDLAKDCHSSVKSSIEKINSEIEVMKLPVDKLKEKEPLVLFQYYCSQCHGNKDQLNPPHLPLDNENALKNYKAKSGISPLFRLQNNIMPPSYSNHQLPDVDRAILIKFFDKK